MAVLTNTNNITTAKKTVTSTVSNPQTPKKTTAPTGLSAMQKAYVNLTPEEEAAIKDAQTRYGNATTDKERQKAHADAEQIRSKHDFSGGASGTDYVKIPSAMEKAIGSTLSQGGYTSTLTPEIASLLKSINTSSFNYDPTKDEQFQKYKGQMIDAGQKAYTNSVAGASIPGVSTNSVAEQIAQGANTQYLNKIGDAESTYMDKAYQRFMDDRTNNYNQVNALLGIDNTGYSRYADNRNFNQDVKQQNWQNNFNQKQFNENVRQFDKNFSENQRQFNKTYAFDERKQSFAERQALVQNAIQQGQLSVQQGQLQLERDKYKSDNNPDSFDNQLKLKSAGMTATKNKNGGYTISTDPAATLGSKNSLAYKDYNTIGRGMLDKATYDTYTGSYKKLYSPDQVKQWALGLPLTDAEIARLLSDLGV